MQSRFASILVVDIRVAAVKTTITHLRTNEMGVIKERSVRVRVFECVRVSVRVRVCACACARVHVMVCERVHVYMHVLACARCVRVCA